MASIAVIGAGFIGLSSASFLQRRGHDVTIIDPLPPGTSTSYGNSGMLSVDGSIPMAMPGMLRNVPKWLRDPNGPLYVRPSYFPKALPWLIRWIIAGQMKNVRTASAALRSLHKNSVEPYRELLGPRHFDSLVKLTGQIHLWDTPSMSLSERIGAELRHEQGIVTQPLSLQELQDLVPGITPTIKRALLFPNNGNVVNPLRLSQTIAQLFTEAGGAFLNHRVLRVNPHEGGMRVLTNCLDLRFDKVVVAAGAWSQRLLAPLGYRIPLETERGYHMQLSGDTAGLRIPLLFRSRGFSAAPMEMGLRLSGTVEFAGLESPPSDQRGEALLKQGKTLFPSLAWEDSKMWMGFRPSVPDSVPILDQSSMHPNLFLAFGHGHLGLTTGAVSGKLIAQLVCGETPSIDMRPYSLSRY